MLIKSYWNFFQIYFLPGYKDKNVQNKYICTFYYDVMNKIEIIQY